jgi:phosphoserine aminotransferase
MTPRVFNFSPGPAVLPLPVLEEAQRELLSLPGVGMSILEISHRSQPFLEILASAEANLRRLLTIPGNYRVLFLQGGSRLQFCMVPMNLLGGRSADYVVTGSWGEKALEEAHLVGRARTAFSSQATRFDRLPAPGQLDLDPAAAYVHFTSNETIQGVQFPAEPDTGRVPLVCDASSDFLSRPIDVRRYGLIYACAQKNAGPAGVTIVIVRDDMLAAAPAGLPSMLDYRQHVKENSLFNTPPTFGVYIVNLVTRWLLHDIGGLAAMAQTNRAKAKLLYDVIDGSGGFYVGHAQPDCRSMMNVTFRFASQDVEKKFLAGAAERGLCELKGHRSVGGIRASIYNAMPVAGVRELADYMTEFRRQANSP